MSLCLTKVYTHTLHVPFERYPLTETATSSNVHFVHESLSLCIKLERKSSIQYLNTDTPQVSIFSSRHHGIVPERRRQVSSRFDAGHFICNPTPSVAAVAGAVPTAIRWGGDTSHMQSSDAVATGYWLLARLAHRPGAVGQWQCEESRTCMHACRRQCNALFSFQKF